MEKLNVNMFRITVIVNPLLLGPGNSENSSPGITILCDDIIVGESGNSRQLPIPQGIAVIGLYIMTLPGGDGTQALFADNPIQWLGDEPDNAFLVQSWGFGHVTIVDFNTVRNATQHPFNIVITYGPNGDTFHQDPTIVNEPPMPVG